MRITLLLLLLCSGMLSAQISLDSTYSYGGLQALLKDGQQKRDFRQQAMAYFLMGQYEETQTHNTPKAFEYITKCVDLCKITNDSATLFRAKLSLANYYVETDLKDEAIRLLTEAKDYYERKNNLRLMTRALARLSEVYRMLGEYEKEQSFLDQCLNFNKYLRDTLLEISFLFNKVYNYEHQQQLDKAIALSYHTLELSKIIHQQRFIGQSQFNIGRLSQLKGDYPAAIEFLQLSVNNAIPAQINTQKRDIYYQLATCYAHLQDFPTAYEYMFRYSQLNDSILNKDRQEAVSRLALQYDSKQKRAEIELLARQKLLAEENAHQQNGVVYTLAFSLVALVTALAFIILSYRQRIQADQIILKQTEEITRGKINELEYQLNIETMHSMMQGQETERQRVARDLHDSLGGLLSTIRLRFDALKPGPNGSAPPKDMDQLRELLDETIREVRNIAQDLQPGALLQFGLIAAINDLINRSQREEGPAIYFQHYGTEKKLAQGVALNAYRIIQELLNNSLKHAQAKEILIQLTQNEHELIIMVEDDGKGFETGQVKEGMGTENIAARVNFMKGELSVQSVPGEGTTTLVTAPLENA